ncbi:Maf-like protein [Gordonia hirsuta DSM 44140 = NBRC 16056]|uniref:Nucleoside triphosphate pyrophosphatase n=1 Tax=Gordonia hirsuta DSM 44140 = NBRC 16056 TaxID=1121927 RepID=L7L6F4_9ACTN|nr:nucleoside triphosphate pyrophosphatase [Gordonia hirsuta]GAC56735.1 Maf-like protein [Gordonia hirsuta DSM 44140 = NBRC 16056]
MTRVLLGSASPARRGVLRAAGIDPLVLVSDLDEDALAAGLADRPAAEVVTELAKAKGAAIVAQVLASADPELAQVAADGVVLTCDSMLLLDGELAGKPKTPAVARERWRRMRGHTGELLTGHTVTRMRDGAVAQVSAGTRGTRISFSDVSDEVIDAYVATGEPLQVAGAFTLDGLGGWLLDGIDGDPSSVIGISLPLTRELLGEVGVSVTDLWRR